MDTTTSVIGLGEILWDLFPEGARFGGAPANLVCHAAEMGATSSMIGAVGDDELGTRALQELRTRGIDVSGVEVIPGKPTGTVPVTLDAQGKPTFEIVRDVAWDELSWSERLAERARQARFVCFGTLGQRGARTRATIRQFLKSEPKSARRLLDINLRPPYFDDRLIAESLELATLLKLNDDELPIVGRAAGIAGSGEAILEGLLQKYRFELVALTRGSHGSLLLTSAGGRSDHPGLPTTVRDTVGAGDAFAATLAVGLQRGVPLDELNAWANEVARYVCTQPGATPRLPADVARRG